MVGNRQADAPNGAGDREALRLAYQLMSQRVSHFEQLILGMATVGMAGWGLLLAGPSTESVDSPGRFMFVAVFSGMVASAFSGLYMARCSFNRVVFRIEAALELAVLNIKAIQAVFHDFRKLSKERTT